jgi:hypothetical protein
MAAQGHQRQVHATAGLGIGKIGRKQRDGAWQRWELARSTKKSCGGGAAAGCVAGVGGNFRGGGWWPRAEENGLFHASNIHQQIVGLKKNWS